MEPKREIPRIYLDTCVFNRPFDDQTQPRIWLETQAFSIIMQMVENHSIALITSSVVSYEGSMNPSLSGRIWIGKCTSLAIHSQQVNLAIHKRAKSLENQGFKALDALHLACAEAAGADYFVTCDDRLIRRWSRGQGTLYVCNPVDLVQILTGRVDKE